MVERTDPSGRVPERSLGAREAMRTMDEVAQGFSRTEAEQEAQRMLGMEGVAWAAASQACPFGVDLQQVAALVAARDWTGARARLERSHPWPGVLGRCCHRFCEQAIAGAWHPSVLPDFRGLERAIGDHTTAGAFEGDPAAPGTVAVIGAGSSGLGCAFVLRRLGHPVTVLEGRSAPGGKLLTGYPPFRMGKRIVAAEMDAVRWGAEVRYGVRVDRHAFRSILAQYDAVFLGVGHDAPKTLSLPGSDLLAAFLGAEYFLEACWTRTPPLPPEVRDVAVIGCGYTALDVARTVVRLGGRPHIVYRRGPEDCPIRPAARPHLFQTLDEEGVQTHWHATPVRVEAGPGLKRCLVCTTAGDDGVLRLPCDAVITAVGSVARLDEFFDDAALAGVLQEGEGRGGRLVAVDPLTRMTQMPKVWAGGDLVGTTHSDSAFADGMAAGEAIHAYLDGTIETWVRSRYAAP